MKKKFLLALGLFTLLPLVACSSGEVSSSLVSSSSSEEEVAPVGELQSLFARLRDNNFSIAYNDRYASNNNVRYQDSYYTEYSLQSEGDFGFNGYAQGDGFIYSYNIVDNEIVPGLPIVNNGTGMRYESIYDLREGFGDFDYTYLPETVGEDGWYDYTFGVNTYNDRLLETILLRRTYNPASQPVSFKMAVRGQTLVVDAVLLEYELQNDRDTASCTVYAIGATENQLIKDYLAGGGTSKEPLDRDFFQTITPYLERNNFKTHLDATEYTTTASYSNFQMDQYFYDTAVVYERLDVDEGVYGQIQTDYGVAHFTMDDIDSERLEIASTATNEDLETYDYLYGDYLTELTTSLYFSDFVGYKDDTRENSYYLTDTYLQSILSYICYFQTDTQENAIDSLRFEIDDFDKHEFTLYFNMINRTANLSLGTYKVSFSMPGEVSFNAVDRYLNVGGVPSSQPEGTLETVLEKFKGHNYSMDIMTGSGLAKSYFTPNYFYTEVYGSPSNNYGYLKEGESIYEFTLTYNSLNVATGITINRNTDYASGTSPMTLPGVGDYQGAENDLFYMSAFSDEIYDYDAYYIDTVLGTEYYRNGTTGFATSLLNYFYPSQTNAYAYGAGFIVSDGEDPYDTRVSLICSYVSRDGTEYGMIRTTYYDIGGTSHAFIDNYLEGAN